MGLSPVAIAASAPGRLPAGAPYVTPVAGLPSTLRGDFAASVVAGSAASIVALAWGGKRRCAQRLPSARVHLCGASTAAGWDRSSSSRCEVGARPSGKAPLQDAEESPTLTAARKRFAQRQAQWVRMHREGKLRQEVAGEEVEHAEKLRELARRKRKNRLMMLQAAAKNGASDDEVFQEVSEMVGTETWLSAVTAMLDLGKCRLAWRMVQACADQQSRSKDWRRAAVNVGTSVLEFPKEAMAMVRREPSFPLQALCPLDEALAQEVHADLWERDLPLEVAEVELEMAAAAAYKGWVVMSWEKSHGDEDDCSQNSKIDASTHAARYFRLAMDGMEEVRLSAASWQVPQVGHIDRWNRLLRLVAKQRNLANVFKVLDTMESLRVEKDRATYEFVARAAVAAGGVRLNEVADSFEEMPPAHFPEIVFLGRSNVGKSSLLNSLLHMKALAPVAATPGYTTRFYFYDVNRNQATFPRMTFVDVPGLGVATADDTQVDHWKETLFRYLRARGPRLRGVFHLVNSGAVIKRCGMLTEIDVEIADVVLNQTEAEYTMVLTKADTLNYKDGRDAKRLVKHWISESGLPEIRHLVASSIKTCIGHDTLWKRLWSCVNPDSVRLLGNDLLGTKAELDTLADEGDVVALLARAKSDELQQDSDAWEYAVRCLLRAGALEAAWETVLAAAKSESCEVKDIKTLAPMQMRAALAIGKHAIWVAGDAAQVSVKNVLGLLTQCRHYDVVVDLHLERCVALSTHCLDDGVEEIQKTAERAINWKCRPWNIDTWGELLRVAIKKRSHEAFKKILETMERLSVPQTVEMEEHLALQAVSDVNCLAQADQFSAFSRTESAHNTVLFWGCSETAMAAVEEGSCSLVDAAFALDPPSQRPDEDGMRPQNAMQANWRDLEVNGVGRSRRGKDAHLFADEDQPLGKAVEDEIEQLLLPTMRVIMGPPFAPEDVPNTNMLLSRLVGPGKPEAFHVVHIVDGLEIADEARMVLDSHGTSVSILRPEEVRLPPRHIALQSAALALGVRYTLVVRNVTIWGGERLSRSGQLVKEAIHPKMERRRQDRMAQGLSYAHTGKPHEDSEIPRVPVILGDHETGKGRLKLWIRLWECI